MNADFAPITGDGSLPSTRPDVDELWELIRDHRARIERLESTALPLPNATERGGVGRRRVKRGSRTPQSVPSYPPLSAVPAFQDLAPITARYAAVPIREGFNWDDCATRLETGEWYLVVFRSVRREAIDDLTLEMHDYGAYIEAQRRALGLVYYFRGSPNEQRECLSFCIWCSREEAARAAQLPLHRVAMSIAEEKYEWYALERYTVRKIRPRSPLEIVPIDGGGHAIASS